MEGMYCEIASSSCWQGCSIQQFPKRRKSSPSVMLGVLGTGNGDGEVRMIMATTKGEKNRKS